MRAAPGRANRVDSTDRYMQIRYRYGRSIVNMRMPRCYLKRLEANHASGQSRYRPAGQQPFRETRACPSNSSA
ncbi:protein of unknown function [Paraburkholderia dioscoreae]|uniref:Uncharacterized protein n=1 Tax=Paraburkholderia dioscoreae TaxID=2604047 RepID=A0A5Q4YV32_9BURK|nr:protein of unknown function [Paraburkholderia dioscoreae]